MSFFSIVIGFLVIGAAISLINFIIKSTKDVAGKVTETPLMEAAIAEDVDKIKELLSSGVDIDETNVVKNTALSLSVIKNKEKSAKFLINAGANLKMWYGSGDIFDLALKGKNERILLSLIEKADAELLYRNNLLSLTTEGNFGTKVLAKLLEKDEDGMYSKVREGNKYSDIDFALRQAADNGNIQNVDFLLKKGAKSTANPILGAVECGSLPLVKKFIELGGDVEAKYSDTGATCLAIAVRKKNRDIAELLLENKANPNIVFNDPRPTRRYSEISLLAYAKCFDYNEYGEFGDKVMVPLLLKYGAKK